MRNIGGGATTAARDLPRSVAQFWVTGFFCLKNLHSVDIRSFLAFSVRDNN